MYIYLILYPKSVMTTKIVEIKDASGNSIFIETQLNPSSLEMIAANDNEVLQAVSKLETSLDPIVNLSKAVIERIQRVEIEKPSEIELNFAIKLSGKLDFWVISGNGEGNIELKIKWALGK